MIHQSDFEAFRRSAALDTDLLIVFLHAVTLIVDTHQTITAAQAPTFGNVHTDTRKALEKFPHLMKRNFIFIVQMQTCNFIAGTDTAADICREVLIQRHIQRQIDGTKRLMKILTSFQSTPNLFRDSAFAASNT